MQEMRGQADPERPDRIEVTPTGVKQLVEEDALGKLKDQWGREMDYAEKAHVHLWGALLVHRLGDVALDAMAAGEPLMLDTESLLGAPSVGCLVCEQPYEPRLRRRRCPGDPQKKRGVGR